MNPDEIRREVLATLYSRYPAAISQGALIRAVQRDNPDVKADGINAAAEFSVSAGYAESYPDPIGSEKFYRLTAAGNLFWERRATP